MSTHHCMHCDCANVKQERCCYCGDIKGVESPMVVHARREMMRLETDPWMIKMIVNVIKEFANSGHSGGSAGFAIPVIYELLQNHNLTPLTDDPDEWMKVGDAEPETWQSTRRSDAFSPNGGGVYFLLDEARDNPSQETIFHESWPMNPDMDRIWIDPGNGTVKQYKGEEEGWIIIHDPFAEEEVSVDGEEINDTGSNTSTEVGPD